MCWTEDCARGVAGTEDIATGDTGEAAEAENAGATTKISSESRRQYRVAQITVSTEAIKTATTV